MLAHEARRQRKFCLEIASLLERSVASRFGYNGFRCESHVVSYAARRVRARESRSL